MRDNGKIKHSSVYKSFSVFIIALFMLFSAFSMLFETALANKTDSTEYIEDEWIYIDYTGDIADSIDVEHTVKEIYECEVYITPPIVSPVSPFDPGYYEPTGDNEPVDNIDDEPVEDDSNYDDYTTDEYNDENTVNEVDDELFDEQEDEQDYEYNQETDETTNVEISVNHDEIGKENDDDSDIAIREKLIELDGITCLLIDSDNDGEIDTFYCPYTNVITDLGTTSDGKFLIDSDDDGEWNYIYDYASGEIKIIGENKNIGGNKDVSRASSSGDLWPFYIIVTIVTVIVAILGYWIYHDQKRLSCKENN